MYVGYWHSMYMHVAASGQCQLSSTVTSTELGVPIQIHWLAKARRIPPSPPVTSWGNGADVVPSFYICSRDLNSGP